MKKYTIEMEDLDISNIESIYLGLENCESATFYKKEIKELQIEFEDDLVLSGAAIERSVKSGRIRIAINSKITSRPFYLWDDVICKQIKKKDFKKGAEARFIGCCNICHMTITTDEIHWTEGINVPYEEIYSYNENEEDETEMGILVCSSAKIDENGDLIILMGKASEFVPFLFPQERIENGKHWWENCIPYKP